MHSGEPVSSPPSDAARRAIFIHSGWRSGSTYLWNKLRADPRVTAFYEPLHEMLGSITTDTMLHMSDATWASGHPTIDRPYFVEYLDTLQDAQGVHNFQLDFSYTRYFDNDEPQADLHAYLESLATLAYDRGQIPVLGLCRSLGRLKWMRAHFPEALHIALYRNAFDQWASSWHQQLDHQNRFFMCAPLLILAASPTFFADEFRREFRLGFVQDYQDLMGCLDYLEQGSDEETRHVALLSVYALSYARSSPHAELVLDIDQLSASSAYQRATEEEIGRTTGLCVSFADARVASHRHPESPEAAIFTRALARTLALAADHEDALYEDGVTLSAFREAFSGLDPQTSS